MWIRKKDEAVSPVVAFMLLLMVIVSFISVLNAYYIPSLKQQAEVEHLQKVEEAFLRLSPDVFQILAHRQNVSLIEPIPLGGGGVIFSPLKSSGYLEVNTSLQEEPLYSVSVTHTSAYGDVQYHTSIRRSRITYQPVGNFWINQGYDWEDGIVNVSKGNRKTYLQYVNEDSQPARDRSLYYDLLLPRITYSEFQNDITSLNIDLINIENIQNGRSINGNGVGSLRIRLIKSSSPPTSLNKLDTLSFSTSKKEATSVIREAFNRAIPWSNVYWDDTQLLLSIPDDAALLPDLQITVWNLSLLIE